MAAPPLQAPAFALEARGLRKGYPSGEGELEVLKGLDLAIRRGEFVAVMGPSGSGKSTLLNLVGLLDRPSGGSLLLMGRDAGRLTERQAALARRALLGFVFQGFNLMPRLTALQNVQLPLAIAGKPRGERQARAKLLLEQVGLGDRLRHQPSQLSGGQKQRVAIARALALDPPILLADEPTGNLDSRTGAEVLGLFDRLHRAGKTIIVVTHDEGVARHAQRIVRLRDGSIERIEAGGAPPLAASPAAPSPPLLPPTSPPGPFRPVTPRWAPGHGPDGRSRP